MKLKKMAGVTLAALLFGLLTGFDQKPTLLPASHAADVILQNGAVYTVDKNHSWAESVAIKNGEIVYVGTNEGVKPFVGANSKVINLQGKMVLPGFFDAHAHSANKVRSMFMVNLVGMNDPQKYLVAVADYAKKNQNLTVIQGYGWANPVFPGKGPKKEALDQIAKDIPVVLTSEDGHSMWVNTKALELAGITKNTPDPEGGIIERDDVTKEPSGTLRENAKNLVSKLVPDYTVEQYEQAILAYQKEANERGITSVHELITTASDNKLEALKSLDKKGQLQIRYRASLWADPAKGPDQVKALMEKRDKYNGTLLQANSVKIFMDGVIEGGTGYLSQPYEHLDEHDHYGNAIWEPQVFNKTVAALDKEGFQVHVHSIGDEATTVTLNGYEFARKENGARDSRHVITHLQLVKPEDIKRFYELGVVASVQPFWFFKEPGYYDEIQVPYLGQERAEREYPMKSFFNAGVKVASSSDYPVTAEYAPLHGIQYGVTRSALDTTDPKEILWPEERASLAEMIDSFTINGAYSDFTDKIAGSIETGKKADLVVVDHNLFKIPVSEISQAKVLYTLFEGREIYRNPAFK